MPSTKRSFALFFSLFATTAALGGACSVMQFDSSSNRSTPEFGVDGSTGGGGIDDTGQDAGPIDIPTPDASVKGTPTFTQLCGGGCMTSDESIGCSIAMNPDPAAKISCQIVATDTGPSS